MKKTTICVISSLVIVLAISVLNYSLNGDYKSYDEETVSGLVKKIDERVNYIDEKEGCYEDGKLIYKSAIYKKEMEYDNNGEFIGSYSYYDEINDKYYSEFIFYDMYYDENEKLIYANPVHYRGANYSIYFDNDKLLYVEISGSVFARGDLDVKGGMKELKKGIREDENFSFVLTDIENCLKYAYE